MEHATRGGAAHIRARLKHAGRTVPLGPVTHYHGLGQHGHHITFDAKVPGHQSPNINTLSVPLYYAWIETELFEAIEQITDRFLQHRNLAMDSEEADTTYPSVINEEVVKSWETPVTPSNFRSIQGGRKPSSSASSRPIIERASQSEPVPKTRKNRKGSSSW